jgi:Zn-dependent protease with chaperone function
MADAVSQAGAQNEVGWKSWSPAQRESFFDAISRHRRAAWRVTFASRVVNLLVALIVAILMAPLFYCALALALDVVNLITPVPNFVPAAGRTLAGILSTPRAVGVAEWIRFLALAALPGLLWMGFILLALQRVLRLCMTVTRGELSTRAPDVTVLAEQRFANVVSEMAIAANLAQPGVFISDRDSIDAVAFGVDREHANIVISRSLLTLLNRAQMEGVAADLIASIANGDMKIGVRAALSLNLFTLIGRLGTLVQEKHSGRTFGRITFALLLPTRSRALVLLSELEGSGVDSDADSPDSKVQAPRAGGPLGAQTQNTTAVQSRWERMRGYVWLPLAGPLVITGFLGAVVNLFVLAPLLSLAWRQRKYMADATAVQLTRDPDTLAGALERIATGHSEALAPWAAHMSIVTRSGRRAGVLGTSFVPMFPSIERRLRALGRMGAHLKPPAAHRIPLKILIILLPLAALLAGLVALLFPLLIYLSLGLTALFTGLPFAIVHALLRWAGHH